MDEQKKISVIMVYTDLQKQQEAIQWLNAQSEREYVELIALDNRENRFSSCAKALNYGAERAVGEILVFMHQDIYLWDSEAIRKLYGYTVNHPETIVGVAGKCYSGEIVTDIFETKDRDYRGTRANGKIMEVAALDECLFAMTRSRWEMLRFDEMCCDNWHGYAMDVCFSNTLQGGRNILLPMEICHESQGNSQTASFRKTIGNLVRKYRGTKIQRIQGTCIDISCSWIGYGRYIIYSYLRDILVRWDILKYFSALKCKLRK